MKLATREAIAYFRKPDPDATGLLIFGADAMRVAAKRQEVITALIGPRGEEEMRLTRIPASELRKDKAMLSDAMRAVSFFPGPRVALVEEATDTVTPIIKDALADWQSGDAQVIVTAGALKATSALRKAFESGKTTYAAGLYDTPLDADEIAAMMSTAGLSDVSPDARNALMTLSRTLEPGDFRQTVEKLGLYKIGDTEPVGIEDVEACAPQSAEAGLDELLNIVAEARVGEIAGVLQRLYAQGTLPVGLCIGAMRHFRALHTIACDPGGTGAGIGRLRPPVFGPRRDAMLRQVNSWGRERLERALKVLIETDLTLRSSQPAPQKPLMERTLIRLAMMARR